MHQNILAQLHELQRRVEKLEAAAAKKAATPAKKKPAFYSKKDK